MPGEIEVSTVIGDIYEASYQPTFWPNALESIARFTHSSSAALMYQDNELDSAGDAYTYNISAEISAKHKAYGADPNFQIMSNSVPLGKAAAIDHIIRDRKELESLYGVEFNQLLAEADMYYLGGALLFMDDVHVAAIGLQRKKSMGGWTAPQIEKLDVLIPHLQRAINIQKEFTRLYISEKAFHKGLDKLITGMVLFDKALKPIYINPVARSILDYHPAISMTNDMICTNSKQQTMKIHDALLMAVSPEQSLRDSVQPNFSIGLKHPDYQSPLPVLISHTQGILDGFVSDGHHAHAVMCFSDPEKTLPIVAEELAGVYRLTPAEAQVAVSIAHGISPSDIASCNEVAVSTVRSQLKAVFSKVGVKSQSELTKVILSGPFVKDI
ncbi:MAG: helix-turn-helix transcriptional regulator [Gammaproteobacteria bacterium]|nr:helix-turn-helix transcriptional regulator [Gammaproteobacteria bacterium]